MILSDLIILYIKIVILFNVKNSKMVQDEATDTVQWKTDRKLYTTYRLMPHSTTLNDPNPAFKAQGRAIIRLFDVNYVYSLFTMEY